ncbi:hypothetical protein D3C73_1634670 [compost metagenome]
MPGGNAQAVAPFAVLTCRGTEPGVGRALALAIAVQAAAQRTAPGFTERQAQAQAEMIALPRR